MLNQDLQFSAMSSQATYTDMGDLARLRQRSQQDQRGALEDVARQFEGVFLQMVLKSMREASFGDPIFDSNQGQMYRDMFDKQIALDMTRGKGLGLADSLVRQLEQYLPPEGSSPASSNPSRSAPGSLPSVSLPSSADALQNARQSRAANEVENNAAEFASAQEFVETLWPLAQNAAKKLDAAPEALVAQAALETGWGQHMLRHADGRPTFNLFNIKADQQWQGDKVAKQTLEYRGGVPVQERAPFRAYDSLEESFQDYVEFLRGNPRYGEALQHAASAENFVRSLQRAGYATDPEYADKVIDIMQRNVLQEPVARNDGAVSRATG